MAILHVDMDAFYASIEMLKNPELRKVPMYVGGGKRGVVLSANYAARRFGIRSGMSASRAKRLFPDVLAVPPDFESYELVSRGVFGILGQITDKVEAVSIDEAFLDVTGARLRLGEPRRIGELIRALVAAEQQISCSVGIGPNKLIAKMATNLAKPDGLLEVKENEVASFLRPQPVAALWGVGEATEAELRRFGLYLIGDLADTEVGTLQRVFGPKQGAWLHQIANGIDESVVLDSTATAAEKSVGANRTFPVDTDDLEIIKAELLRLSTKVAARLRAARKASFTVTLTVRFADYSTITRAQTMRNPTDVTDEIYAEAVKILDSFGFQRVRIRLVGVRASQLVDVEQAYRQPALGAPDRGMRDVEKVADEIAHKFGQPMVKRATLCRYRR